METPAWDSAGAERRMALARDRTLITCAMRATAACYFVAFATAASKPAALGLFTVLRIRMSGGSRLLPP